MPACCNATAVAMPPIPPPTIPTFIFSFIAPAGDDLAELISEDISFWMGD
jgi:hypothetical protein